jgi:carbon monoxide dehydrogenase subunit G
MRIEATAEFKCTPEELWPYLEQPEKIVLWMKGVEGLVADQPGPTRVGSTAKMRIREGGKVQVYDERITGWDPPHHLALVMSGGGFPAGMEMNVAYTMTRAGAGTRMDYLCEAELKGLYKLFGPVGTAMARKQLKGFFQTLRGLVENRPSETRA